MNLDELKVKFDKKKVSAIEVFVEKAKSHSLVHRKDFISALFYLQKTGRFRENKSFKNATFEQYINDRFLLRLSTFNSEKWAYLKYPVEVDALGPGVLSKIKRKCNGMKISKVLDEIKSKSPNWPETPGREEIDKAINRHAKPVSKKPQKKTATQVQRELDRERETTRNQNIIIKEQVEQIKKLKASVNKYKEKYENLLMLIGPLAEFAQEDSPVLTA